MKKIAFAFEDDVVADRQLLGNKGAGLFRMVKMGLRVPQGFTITTALARAFAQEGTVPKRLDFHVSQEMRRLEKKSGLRFGDLENPLLVSVRSGAEVSMPGMMITVLNLGMNQAIAAALAARTSERYAYDCYQRFLSMFGESVLGVDKERLQKLEEKALKRARVEVLEHLDGAAMKKLAFATGRLVCRLSGQSVPEDARQQLDMAIEAVLRSWNSPIARAYRAHNKISGDLGTAVTVQRMVMGNRDERSCSGVAFSRNVVAGGNEIWGDFLVGGQGEVVVNGSRKVPDMAAMKVWDEGIFSELVLLLKRLEREENWPVEVEFTVESGVLYILQVRRALFTPVAAAVCAVNFHHEGLWSKEQAVSFVPEKDRHQLRIGGLDEASVPAKRRVGKGKPASSGIASGTVVFSSKEAEAAAARGEKVVLVRNETSPDDIQGMIAAVAVVTIKGGPSSHAAIVARSLGKPCVVSLVNEPGVMPKAGDLVTVDGSTGLVIFGGLESEDGASGLRTTGGANKEVQLYLKWANQEEQKSWEGPAIKAGLMEEIVPVSQLAAQFYLSEAMAWQAQGTPLEAEYKQLRRETHTLVAHRIATYFALAIGGELTHGKTRVLSSHTTAAHMELSEKFGIVFDDASYRSAERTMPLLFKHKLASLVRYSELAVELFCRLPWAGAFGGLRWGAIAKALHSYLKGDLTASKFCDHAFDLHHNTGSVFGKHVMIRVDGQLHELLTRKRYAGSLEALAEVFAGHMGAMSDWYERGVKEGLWQALVVSAASPASAANLHSKHLVGYHHHKPGSLSECDKIDLQAASDPISDGDSLIPGWKKLPKTQPVFVSANAGVGKSQYTKMLLAQMGGQTADQAKGAGVDEFNKYTFTVSDSEPIEPNIGKLLKGTSEFVKNHGPIIFSDGFHSQSEKPEVVPDWHKDVIGHEITHGVWPGPSHADLFFPPLDQSGSMGSYDLHKKLVKVPVLKNGKSGVEGTGQEKFVEVPYDEVLNEFLKEMNLGLGGGPQANLASTTSPGEAVTWNFKTEGEGVKA